MGLAEQRKVKEVQDQTIPKVDRQIEQACGKVIPIEVDWDSFTRDPDSISWLGTTSGLYLIADAIEAICSDDLGKGAVAAGVKTIGVKNVAGASEEKVDFASGVLTVHWGWGKAGRASSLSSTKVREAVEAGL